MLKSLVASCLCALSVNVQPLSPSRAISSANAVVGEHYRIELEITSFSESISFPLFDSSFEDIGYSLISLYSFISSQPYYVPASLPLIDIDYCVFYLDNSILQPGYYDLLECDSITDYTYSFTSFLDQDVLSVSYSFEFEVLADFNFNSEVLSYITKVEPPYTPPSRNNLYRLLYDFYYSIFSDDDLAEISTGYNMPFDNWLAHTCTIVTLLVLVFVCFLFLKWLFKVISGLILLKH